MFTVGEFIEKLILNDKVERANAQSEHGETISEVLVDKEMAKWFK